MPLYRVYNNKHKTRTGNYRTLFVRLANKPYTTKQGKQIGQIDPKLRTCTHTPYKQGQEKLEDRFVSTSDVSISMMNVFISSQEETRTRTVQNVCALCQGVSQDHFGSLIHHIVLEIRLGSHFRLRSHFSDLFVC